MTTRTEKQTSRHAETVAILGASLQQSDEQAPPMPEALVADLAMNPCNPDRGGDAG